VKLKKRTMVIALIVNGILVGIGAKIIYTYFSVSEHLRTPEILVLGIVVSAIGIVFAIISFRSDSY